MAGLRGAGKSPDQSRAVDPRRERLEPPTLEAWHASGRRLRFRGHEIFYRVAGRGPVTLLLHGFPTSSWDWARVATPLAERCTVVTPDFLGFGYSAKPPRHEYRIAEQADLCLEVLASLGCREATVVAHDYGDTVAQELLARELDGRLPWRLRAMVLLNGGLFPETHRPRLVQRLLRTPLGPWIARGITQRRFDASLRAIFGPATPPSRAELDGFWALLRHGDGAGAMPRLIRYIDERRRWRERWVGALVRTTVPLSLVAGLDDPVSGRHMVERFRELVPAAAVTGLPGIGHYPQLEAPVPVLGRIMAALEP
ncbi:MAG: alpha/beta hydrolase [Proteobacteria bacterium]|nr:alpha/beta hydrolase [Pseudomonadota bacterium]